MLQRLITLRSSKSLTCCCRESSIAARERVLGLRAATSLRKYVALQTQQLRQKETLARLLADRQGLTQGCVPDILSYGSTVPGDDIGAALAVSLDDFAELLCIDSHGERRPSHQVAQHDGELTSLGRADRAHDLPGDAAFAAGGRPLRGSGGEYAPPELGVTHCPELDLEMVI